MRELDIQTELLLAGLDDDPSRPRVVAIGGGHGMAQVLRGAVGYAGTLSAIVTVADDGGSSGRLAPALDIPPPGDIRKCLIAMSPDETVWRRLFEYRFEASDVDGHSLGNLILASLADIEGDFEAALRAAERLLGAAGDVIPACGSRLALTAVRNGEEIHGQAAVTRSRGPFDEIRLTPETPANPRALVALATADQIVLGPGSLFTSTIATLAVPGIVGAINESKASIVYVANLYTQDGETLGMDVADHLGALLRLAGIRPPNAIVAHSGRVEVPQPHTALEVDVSILETFGVDVVLEDIVDLSTAWPQHDAAKLGNVLSQLVTYL
jgi:uncharacterized cofD-like protein